VLQVVPGRLRDPRHGHKHRHSEHRSHCSQPARSQPLAETQRQQRSHWYRRLAEHRPATSPTRCYRLRHVDVERREDHRTAEAVEQSADQQWRTAPLSGDEHPATEQRNGGRHQSSSTTKPIRVPAADEAAQRRAEVNSGREEVDGERRR